MSTFAPFIAVARAGGFVIVHVTKDNIFTSAPIQLSSEEWFEHAEVAQTVLLGGRRAATGSRLLADGRFVSGVTLLADGRFAVPLGIHDGTPARFYQADNCVLLSAEAFYTIAMLAAQACRCRELTAADFTVTVDFDYATHEPRFDTSTATFHIKAPRVDLVFRVPLSDMTCASTYAFSRSEGGALLTRTVDGFSRKLVSLTGSQGEFVEFYTSPATRCSHNTSCLAFRVPREACAAMLTKLEAETGTAFEEYGAKVRAHWAAAAKAKVAAPGPFEL